MNLFLDNTFVHRLSVVLDSKRGRAIRTTDALALFHFAEHIMFSDEIILSSFQLEATNDLTYKVVEQMMRQGFTRLDGNESLIKFQDSNSDDYEAACIRAGNGLTAELSDMGCWEIERLSKLASDAVMPIGVKVPDFDGWTSRDYPIERNLARISKLKASRAAGALELMILKSERLRACLINLKKQIRGGRFRPRHAVALTAISRVLINEELARAVDAIYSPAPQRARIAEGVTHLFRHQLEKRLSSVTPLAGKSKVDRLLTSFDKSASLPLPLFAMHALKKAKCGSPEALLEAARNARDNKGIAEIREWLQTMEVKARRQGQNYVDAGNELERAVKNVSVDIMPRKWGIFARLYFGFNASVDPSGKFSFSIAGIEFNDIADKVEQRFSSRRRYLAAMTADLAGEEKLGARILSQINRFTARER